MNYYSETVIREPRSEGKSGSKITSEKEESRNIILANLNHEDSADYRTFLKDGGYLEPGMEFPFFFYAIKGSYVYSHHPKISKVDEIRFYSNDVKSDGFYLLEPFQGKVINSKLMSRDSLNEELKTMGYEGHEVQYADFYYVLTVKVLDQSCEIERIPREMVDSKNGNDTFAPSSPKII